MKKKNFLVFSALAAMLIASGTAMAFGSRASVKTNAAVTSGDIDPKSFHLRDGSDGTVSVSGNNLVYAGAWDSNFALTDQVNSTASNYTLSAHVEKSDFVRSGDAYVGFSIYHNNLNYFLITLKWNNDVGDNTIAEGLVQAHVNGAWENVYQAALVEEDQAWETKGTFFDLWSDNYFRDSVTGEKVNIRNKILNINNGFDMTLNVTRSTYKDKLCDIIYLEATGTETSGAPFTARTMKIAVDVFTAPLGVESPLKYRKPQVGFYCTSTPALTYSNIKTTSEQGKVADRVFVNSGTPSTKFVVNDNGSITYHNSNFSTGFAVGDNLDTTTENFTLSADILGNAQNEGGVVGFSYYFDDSNYAVFYLGFGDCTTVNGIHYYVLNGGANNNYECARDNFENAYANRVNQFGFVDYWSDFGGFITDSQTPCALDSNWNHVRDESALRLSKGFRIELQRTRRSYCGRVIDAIIIAIAGLDNSGVERTWYTAPLCMDAFTYPNGGAAHKNLNSAPKVGFYALDAGEITISNIEFNNTPVNAITKERQDCRDFVANYMHPEVATTEVGTGLCISNGWYTDAKTAFASLSEGARTLFVTDAEFAAYANRLTAWAKANGDEIDGNNIITASNVDNSFFKSNSGTLSIALAALLGGALAIALIVSSRKRKANK